MELRKLKALLAALQAAGVTSYRDGDLTLTFGATPVQAPAGDVEVPEADWATGAPLALQKEHERILKQYQGKPKGKAS